MKIPTLSRSMVFFCAFSSENIIINPPLTGRGQRWVKSLEFISKVDVEINFLGMVAIA